MAERCHDGAMPKAIKKTLPKSAKSYAFPLRFEVFEAKSGSSDTIFRGNFDPNLEALTAILIGNFDGIGSSWAKLGTSWGQVGPSWGQVGAKLGQVEAKLRPSWAKLGQVGAKLEPSWGQVGACWGQVGPSWAKLGQVGLKLGSR